jgi:4-amino-4-deoxy-L-arabinose transferase-like glycosyltransferase
MRKHGVRANPLALSPALSRPAILHGPWPIALCSIALFALALIPSLVGLEQHLTADDQDWVRRSVRFSQAVQRGNWRATYQSGHPGVPVLWLASLAIGPQRSAELAVLIGDLPALEKAPAYLPAIYDVRRALAVVSAGLTVLLALLAWRLFGTGPALLAGLLLAGEPFLVAHGYLFHTDPLLAQLMAVSVLAALLGFRAGGSWPALVGSGLAAGLALLTKAPAIFLFAFVPLLGLLSVWPRLGRPDPLALRRLLLRLIAWSLAAGAIYLLLWPALWVDALGTLARTAQAVRGEGETARTWGSFFFGQATRGDPGLLFYPVATLLRLSPVTLLGLLLFALLGLRKCRAPWQSLSVDLVGYLVLFTLMMSLSPKKIDRYLLPVYPIAVILGALGWWLAIGAAARWLSAASAAGSSFTGPSRQTAAALAVGAAQLALVMSVQPYPLSFFNPLVGGPAAARSAVVVGWGEGTDQVAAYLDGQPNAPQIVVSSIYHDLIHPLFRGTGVPLARWQDADYLADYVNMDQRGLVPGPLQAIVQTEAPVFSAHINGLDYVRLYRIPPDLRAQGGPSGAPRRTTPSR